MGFADTETRSAPLDAAAGKTLAGYAAVFWSEAVIAGEFRERIAPGAFTRSLRENDVVALMHHDTGRILGRMSAGTLRLREDAKGLHFEIDADPTTPDGAAALGLVGRRDLKAMSFGFRVRSEDWSETKHLPLRTLTDVSLMEVSIVTWPAYEATSAGLRSLENARATNVVSAARRVRMKAELEQKIRGIR